MLYFIIWLGCSFLVAMWGNSKKVGFTTSFIVSFLLSPFIGLIVVAVSDNEEATSDQPIQSGSVIFASGNECRFCEMKTAEKFIFCPGCDRDHTGLTKADYQAKAASKQN